MPRRGWAVSAQGAEPRMAGEVTGGGRVSAGRGTRRARLYRLRREGRQRWCCHRPAVPSCRAHRRPAPGHRPRPARRRRTALRPAGRRRSGLRMSRVDQFARRHARPALPGRRQPPGHVTGCGRAGHRPRTRKRDQSAAPPGPRNEASSARSPRPGARARSGMRVNLGVRSMSSYDGEIVQADVKSGICPAWRAVGSSRKNTSSGQTMSSRRTMSALSHTVSVGRAVSGR